MDEVQSLVLTLRSFIQSYLVTWCGEESFGGDILRSESLVKI